MRLTAENVHEYLGSPKILPDEMSKKDQIGVATGLAWTPTGGEIMFIESTAMRGKGGLMLTGKLGDVMKESAQAALSYARSHAEDLGIDEGFFQDQGHPHPRARRRHSQGWPISRHHHGNGNGFTLYWTPG